ncbi:hypothetical protein AB0G04_31210 [Actinoplanes sp. NPDC023801]|uniref:hypothetical protein n=1 Tax=Actinoplanes sp. NPDC023801 TaxID=3154595 RepID=UPI00340CB6E7
MNQGWAERDGNGHYWPAQPPGLPPSFYPTPADPLVSPNFEGWWRRSFALAGRIWKPALTLQAILLVPMAALVVPAGVVMSEQQEKLQKATVARPGDLTPLADFMTAVLGSVGLTFVAALISMVATSITARMVVLAATGQPVTLKAAAGTALRRAHAVIGWQIVATLVAGVSLLACFLPVIYVAAVIMILPVVVTLERGTGLGRCFALFNADLGTSVSRIATIFGLNVAASVVLGVIGAVLEVAVGGTTGAVAAGALNALYYLPAGVVLPPLLVTAYADMRARREPFSTAYLAPVPQPA